MFLKSRMWFGHLALMTAAVCSGFPAAGAEHAPQWASEYELKAAFIYNLLSFVEWPADSGRDPIVIGVASDTPLASVMGAFLGSKHVGPRGIEVRDVHSRGELRACNVVLITYAERARAREAISQLQDTSVLTIGDGERFARLGGVVAFVAEGNSLRLAINTQAADRAHIKLSSKLLNIAELVTGDSVPGGTRP